LRLAVIELIKLTSSQDSLRALIAAKKKKANGVEAKASNVVPLKPAKDIYGSVLKASLEQKGQGKKVA